MYNSDDDVKFISHHIEVSSPEIPYRKTSVNQVRNSSKTPSDLAFDRVITVLFNQVVDGPISMFFTNTYGRKDIHDMINIDSSQLGSSRLNQSEQDLISTLFICNRDFRKYYGSPIMHDWSNVTPENFDNIGEEYGYISINRDVVDKSSIDESQYVINNLFEQELDCPMGMSLLEHTKGSKEIDIVSNMTEYEIDKL